MTKDKNGNFIFKKGKVYRMKVNVNPVWPAGREAACIETRTAPALEGEDVIHDQFGLFQLGDDTRWWCASDQFDEI